ncbi:MAG: hypothetical protein K2X11_10920, partial [Acetobacteraceae bacterium]|nr:hypothetical protein [Acetobacteraceae bacterium]
PASAPGSGALAPAPPRGAPGAPYRGTGEAAAQTWLLAFESVTVRVLAEAPPQDGAPRSFNWRGLRISCPG